MSNIFLKEIALVKIRAKMEMEYKSTKRHTNADGLSRMSVQSCNDSDNLDAEEIFHISHFENLPVTSDAIAHETRRTTLMKCDFTFAIIKWLKQFIMVPFFPTVHNLLINT
jgi:hypothetical protein